MNKNDIKYSIERALTIKDEPKIPEQTLNDTSWVLISSKLNGENKVYVFNNDSMPEDYQYADFADWATLSVDDILMAEPKIKESKYSRRNSEEHTSDLKFYINSEGKMDVDGWSKIVIDEDGISCHVLHFYNGGVNMDNLQSKVALCQSSCYDCVSDFYDDKAHEAELDRERRFQP